MDLEDLISKLELDCNSLNSLSGSNRHIGHILLGIESRIFEAIDILKSIKEEKDGNLS